MSSKASLKNAYSEDTRIALLEQSMDYIVGSLQRIEHRFDHVDKKFEEIDEKFERLERKFDDKIDKLE